MDWQAGGTVLIGVGFVGQVLWTLVNLRLENRLLERMDALKGWMEGRFVTKEFCRAHHAHNVQRIDEFET